LAAGTEVQISSAAVGVLQVTVVTG
jgi:hypothetical protein